MMNLLFKNKLFVNPLSKLYKLNIATKIEAIKLGDLGEGTKDATVKKWYKKIGDLVKEEETVVEVFTDKLVAPIPSSFTGKLTKIYFDVDEKCLVGKTLCDIDVPDENKTTKANITTNTTNSPKESIQFTNMKTQDLTSSSSSSSEDEANKHSDKSKLV